MASCSTLNILNLARQISTSTSIAKSALPFLIPFSQYSSSSRFASTSTSASSSTSSNSSPPLSSRELRKEEVRKAQEAQKALEAQVSDNDVKISALQALGEKSRDDGEPIGNVGERRRSAPQGGGGSALFAGRVTERVRKPFTTGQLYSPSSVLKSTVTAPPRIAPRPALLGPSRTASLLSDPFHILSINPLSEVQNTQIVTAYTSQMGKIKSRAETGLSWKNQRRMGKMVRRARGMGLVSRWSNELPKGEWLSGETGRYTR